MAQLTSGTLLRDLRTQRLRLTLTLFGIVWGTVAVVTLLAFGTALERRALEDMGTGANFVTISTTVTSLPHRGFPAGRRIRLVPEDASLLRDHVPEIALLSEVTSTTRLVRVGNAIERPSITGVQPEYEGIRQIHLLDGGRFLSPLDMDQRRRVAVLGSRLNEALFNDADAVGRQVMVDGTGFTVVGVVERESGFGAGNQLFIPATTYRGLYGARHISSLAFSTVTPALAPRAIHEAISLLAARHRFDPEDLAAVRAGGSFRMDQEIGLFFLGLKIFLAVVGGFTLVVGGIGVANIMFVVVRERRREIGIKRAVGARRSHILLQFLLETALLVALGAVLGFLIAAGLVNLLAMLPFTEELGKPVISMTVAGGTIAVLGVIALAAGFFPARRAAQMDPVACLRG